MRKSELAFLLFLVVFLASSIAFEDLLPTGADEDPRVSFASSLSTGWYCPAPSSDAFTSVMSTTNHGEAPVTLRRWSVGQTQSSAFVESVLDGHRRVQVAVKDLNIPSATALAEVFGGVTSADLTVVKEGGLATSACTVQPSDRWFFAIASTSRDQDTALLVSNPFEEEAVIRVRQFLPDRQVSPSLLKRVVIPQLSQVTLDLKEFIPATPSFGLEITATVGRVIVSRLSRNGGISLNVGVRNPSPNWLLAGGEVPSAGEELLVITNPSDKESLVQVVFQTDDQRLEPGPLQEVALAAGRQMTIKASDHLPRGTKHSALVTSLNEVALIVERQVFGQGFENVFGVTSGRRRWAVSVGTAAGAETITILNDSQVQATVQIALISDAGESRPPELTNLQIAPGRRLSVSLDGLLNGTSTAVVEALSGSIVIERRLGGQSDFTVSTGIALPE